MLDRRYFSYFMSFVLITISTVFLLGCGEEVNPLKSAKTPEECVQNEKCVWEAFRQIAFGEEISPSNREELTDIKKWIKSPTVMLGDPRTNKDPYLSIVKKHVDQLNAAIDLPILIWKKSDNPAHILFFFSDNLDYDMRVTYKDALERIAKVFDLTPDYFTQDYLEIKKIKEDKSFSSVIGDPKNGIHLSLIFIPTTMPDEDIRFYVEYYLTKSLGLTNTLPSSPLTIFADEIDRKKITQLDWLLLKILYHSSIELEMTESEVKLLFKDIYNDIMAGGLNDR